MWNYYLTLSFQQLDISIQIMKFYKLFKNLSNSEQVEDASKKYKFQSPASYMFKISTFCMRRNIPI